MSPTPLLLAPLRLEAAALRRGSRQVQIEHIGMGPVRATAARVRLGGRERAGRPIVLAGVAGGLVDDLSPGDIVVATAVGTTESDESIALFGAGELAEHLASAGLAPRLAPIICSPRILRGAERRGKAAASGALVVEMEALWLTPLGQRHPFAVVRVVLDTVGAELGSRATPRAAARAYQSLRELARALETWAPAHLEDPSRRSH